MLDKKIMRSVNLVHNKYRLSFAQVNLVQGKLFVYINTYIYGWALGLGHGSKH